MNRVIFSEILDLLRTPGGAETLAYANDRLKSEKSGMSYDVLDGIPQLLSESFDREIADRYEAHASEAGTSHSTVGYKLSFHYRRVHSAFRRLFSELPADALVADIGCGHGEMTREIARDNRVVGVDLAQAMLLRAETAGLIPLRASATELPLADGAVDCAVAAEMLQHVDDPTALLSELARITRIGGRVLVSTINKRSIARRLNRMLRGMDLVEQARLRTADEVLTAAQALPLRLVKVVWILSPIPFEAAGRSGRSLVEPFAQNFILVFERS